MTAIFTPLTYGLAILVVTRTALEIAARLWKLAKDAHWTRQARLLWPIRNPFCGIKLGACSVFGAIPIALAAQASPVLTALAGLTGVFLALWHQRCRHSKGLGPAGSMAGLPVNTILMLATVTIAAARMPAHPAPGDWGVAFIALVVCLILTQNPIGSIGAILLADTEERVTKAYREAAAEGQQRPPKVGTRRMGVAVATSYLPGRRIVLGKAFADELTPAELQAWARATVASPAPFGSLSVPQLAFLLRHFPWVFLTPLSLLTSGFFNAAMLLYGFSLIATVIYNRLINKSIQSISGAAGRAASAEESVALLSAEEKACRHALHPVVFVRGSHRINLYDRLDAAGLRPDYPNPAPPDATHPALAWAGILMVAAPWIFLSFRLPESVWAQIFHPPL